MLTSDKSIFAIFIQTIKACANCHAMIPVDVKKRFIDRLEQLCSCSTCIFKKQV